MHEILHKDKIADTCALRLSVFITNKYNKLLLTLDVIKKDSYSGHFSTMLRTLQWSEEPQREASVYSLSSGVLSLIHVLFSLAWSSSNTPCDLLVYQMHYLLFDTQSHTTVWAPWGLALSSV